MSIYEQIQKAFSLTQGNIYLRDDIKKAISSFLSSKTQDKLHITGNPGVGKTSIVLNACSKIRHLYLNAYRDTNIKQQIMKSKCKIVIIDEYDLFMKSKDHKFVIYNLKSSKRKLITLSNDINTRSINIKPYTAREIEEILKLKIREEVKADIISDTDIKLISKMFSGSGDMRLVFNYILNNFNSETSQVEINRNQAEFPNKSEESWHHKVIRELIGEYNTKREVYSKYISKCDEMSITNLRRSDFNLVYELIQSSL